MENSSSLQGFASWSILTVDFLLILAIALGSGLLASLLQMANSKWRFHVRKFAVAFSVLFPVAFVLLLILLANGHSTFQWLGHPNEEHPLNGWHNYTFLVCRQIICFLIVAGLYGLFLRYQHLSEKDSSPLIQRRFRNITLLIPFIFVPYATMMGWDFEMTQIPRWHSASYGAYFFVSNFHAFLAFFTIFLFFTSRSGKLSQPIPLLVFNRLAQFMFAFTILWTYFFFTQFLIFWYGRLPEDTTRYFNMMYHGYGPLWWTFFSLKFVIPIWLFIFQAVRHNPVVITSISFGIVIGSWLERYTWISGSTETDYYHWPMTAPFDIIATLVVFGVAWFAVKWSLNRYGLVRA